jgi:hypothetical protein
LIQSLEPIFNRILGIAKNENPPLFSEDNKYEIILKRYQDIKENHSQLLFQCQKAILHCFSFIEVYEQMFQIPGFSDIPEQITFHLFDLKQIPNYLNQIFTSISPFIQRINQQAFFKTEFYFVMFYFAE